MTPLRRLEVEELLPALVRLTRLAALRLEACLGEATNRDDPQLLRAALAELDSAVDAWRTAVGLLGGASDGLWEVELPAHDGSWRWSFANPDEVRFRPDGATASSALH